MWLKINTGADIKRNWPYMPANMPVIAVSPVPDLPAKTTWLQLNTGNSHLKPHSCVIIRSTWGKTTWSREVH